MPRTTPASISRTIRFAHQLDRLMTWGMAPALRNARLNESLADWEAMYSDRGSLATMTRALRGVPAGIWVRLDAHGVTTIPAGVAIAALGLGGMVAGGIGSAYPTPLRISIVIAGIGSLLVAIRLITHPRQLVVRHLVAPLLTMAAGFVGMALYIPSPDRWSDQRPAAESPLLDSAMTIAFLTVGAGLVLLALVPATTDKHRLARVAGTTVALGLTSFAITQIIWGLTVAPQDLAITVPSIGAGLAAGSAAHVVPRLRHLEIL